ncbi:NADH-ubiquinone oxidoreductase subunit GRIM-19 [Aspergillus arachidicola]|uniref:NADH dehydrogenase [ubiquinone] 1 alpha subcomplex subunit 13 n=1 Tax=Aspergillus arachidicola TaxID=656916 RepID=A0A2G7FV98_9EURO|nr:NADH-ubiquinone oxidoreductase subunit GRIM-19 [Aspergillus arachidicola]
MPQDMPPVGGYGPVQYKRNIPARGFRPITYLVGMHLLMGYGYYKLFHGIREQKYVTHRFSPNRTPKEAQWLIAIDLNSELAREKVWGRLHILPLLQAEEDRDQVRRHFADKAREKELLGSESKVYNTERFVRPTFVYTPTKVTQ